MALLIAHTFSRTTGGTRWKPYVVRVWYNIHINACPPGLEAATQTWRNGVFSFTPLDLNKTCVEFHLEASCLYFGSAARLQERAYACQHCAKRCECSPNIRKLEPLARLPTPHFIHSRPVCNIVQTVYMC